MKLNDKVDLLIAEAEELLRERGDVRRRQAEWEARLVHIFDRWNELADEAASLMTDEERGRVDEAIEQANNGSWIEHSGPYRRWLRDLADGCSRLPGISAETMKRLLLAWIHPLSDWRHSCCVCAACGLEYPYTKQPSLMEMMSPPAGQGKPRNPELFAACPHCGSPARGDGMMWSHRINERKYEWMRLDGYAGQPIRGLPEHSEL